MRDYFHFLVQAFGGSAYLECLTLRILSQVAVILDIAEITIRDKESRVIEPHPCSIRVQEVANAKFGVLFVVGDPHCGALALGVAGDCDFFGQGLSFVYHESVCGTCSLEDLMSLFHPVIAASPYQHPAQRILLLL